MVIRLIDSNGDLRPLTKTLLPPLKIILDGHLIVTASLVDEHRFAECCRRRNRIVAAQV